MKETLGSSSKKAPILAGQYGRHQAEQLSQGKERQPAGSRPIEMFEEQAAKVGKMERSSFPKECEVVVCARFFPPFVKLPAGIFPEVKEMWAFPFPDGPFPDRQEPV